MFPDKLGMTNKYLESKIWQSFTSALRMSDHSNHTLILSNFI